MEVQMDKLTAGMSGGESHKDDEKKFWPLD